MDLSQQIDLIYILPLAASAIALVNALWAWKSRDLPGMRSLSSLLLAIAVWSVCESIQYKAIGTATKVFWAQIQYLGIATTPVLFLSFSARYTQQDRRLTRLNLGLLWIVPIVTIGMVATNELHHYHWRTFTFNPETNILTYHYGPWFWAFAVTSYTYLIGGTYLLFQFVFQLQKQYRARISLIILAAIIPWVANICHVMGLTPIEGLDPTPISMLVSSVLLTLSIAYFRLIDITPIARHKLVETLNDALIVVDLSGMVVDVNPIALSIVNRTRKDAVRQPAASFFSDWPQLCDPFNYPPIETIEFTIVKEKEGKWFDVRISPLNNDRGDLIGHLCTLRDITDKRKAESERLQLASVIEQAKEAIFITDLEGKIIYANAHYHGITGYTISETLGSTPRILQNEAHNRNKPSQIWDTISKGNIWSGTFINKRKDGSEYHESATIFPIKDESSHITNYAAVNRDITSEVQVRNEIKNFSERLTTLHEIGIQLSLEGDLDALCREAVLAGQQGLDFDRVGIWLVDPINTDYLLGTYGIDEQGRLRDERTERHHKSKHPEYFYALETSKRIYHLANTPLYNYKAEPIGKGEMAISGFWDGDDIQGYISIDNLITGKPLSERQRAILILFSQTLGNLLVRKRADHSLRAFSEKLTTLHEISVELSKIASLEEMIRFAVLSGHDRLGFDRMSIWFVDPENTSLVRGSFGTDEEGNLKDERNLTQPKESSPILKLTCADSHRIYHQKNARLNGQNSENIGNGEIVVSGLWDGKDIIGYIKVENLISRKRLEKYQLEILVLYAQIIGSLSTRMRTTEKIRKVAREQTYLSDISLSAIKQTDYQELLQTLVDCLGELFQADGCFITLWDEEKKIPVPGAAYGPYKDTFKHDRSILPINGEPTKTETVLTSGDVLVIEDSDDSTHISKRIANKYPSRSSLVLPLIANQVKLGAAIISYNEQHHFTHDEIDLAEKASHQIALAMMKNRLLEEAQIRATEAETLRQASAAIVATLNQDEAIERVLEQLNRVVPYDSASVQLLENGELIIVGERGFKDITPSIGLRFKITPDIPHALVIDRREPIIIDDAPREYKAFPNNHQDLTHSWMGVPLKAHEKIIGMLALNSFQPGKFNKNHRRLATAFCDQVAISLENTRLFKEIQWLAIHDSLTRLVNRHHFLSLAKIEFERAKRYEKPLSVIMLDIDHFKQVNDTYGHIIGDLVLQYVADQCVANLRSHDIVARYGGEEFVILLPETTAQSMLFDQTSISSAKEPAKVVAERLKHGFEIRSLETERGSFTMHISLGVAELTEDVSTVEQLIDNADQALLYAKNTGRNRVAIWPMDKDIEKYK